MTKEEIRELVSCTPLSQTEDFIANQQAEIAALKVAISKHEMQHAAFLDYRDKLLSRLETLENDRVALKNEVVLLLGQVDKLKCNRGEPQERELIRLRAVESAAKEVVTAWINGSHEDFMSLCISTLKFVCEGPEVKP